MRHLLGLVAALGLLGVALPALAQPTYNRIPPTCTYANRANCGAKASTNSLIIFSDSDTIQVGDTVAGSGGNAVLAYCVGATNCYVVTGDEIPTSSALTGTTAATFTVDSDGNATVITATASGGVGAKVPVVSLASGALTLNTAHLATAAADYDIPDGACDAAGDVGNWVTVVLEDASTVISITSDDASNVIYVPGLGLDAGDELDSVSTAAHEGQHITLTCLAAEGWYMTGGNLLTSAGAIAWADGDVAD